MRFEVVTVKAMEPNAYNDEQAARSLVTVLGSSRWLAVALAHGYLARLGGVSEDEAARVVFAGNDLTLKRSRELMSGVAATGFLSQLPPRERTGSAQNPITKMFPATITEQRFLELLDETVTKRPSAKYEDEREVRHSLMDFKLIEGDAELPLNIKNRRERGGQCPCKHHRGDDAVECRSRSSTRRKVQSRSLL